MRRKQKCLIPICKNEFLQDVSIELGKRLNSLKYRAQSLEFSVGWDENERLSVTVHKDHRAYIEVIIWENKFGMYVNRKPYLKHELAQYIKYRAILSTLDFRQVGQLVRESILEEPDALIFWKTMDSRLWEIENKAVDRNRDR